MAKLVIRGSVLVQFANWQTAGSTSAPVHVHQHCIPVTANYIKSIEDSGNYLLTNRLPLGPKSPPNDETANYFQCRSTLESQVGSFWSHGLARFAIDARRGHFVWVVKIQTWPERVKRNITCNRQLGPVTLKCSAKLWSRSYRRFTYFDCRLCQKSRSLITGDGCKCLWDLALRVISLRYFCSSRTRVAGNILVCPYSFMAPKIKQRALLFMNTLLGHPPSAKGHLDRAVG